MGRARELSELATGYDSGGLFGFRNRLINGACAIDQRNAGASVTPADGNYLLDRYQAICSQASKYSVQRVADAPSGFTHSMKITSLSAYSITSSDIFHVLQKIEGFNVADFGWGAAGAQTVTFSFWAKSSLTGTFGGSLVNSAEDRSYPFSYTISAANTWEYKTVTIAGDTTGTWLKDSGIGLRCHFTIGVGSNYTATAGAWTAGAKFAPTGAVSVVGTNGATLQVTGVQLEKGSTATSFDYRPYGTEFDLCRRYYQQWGGDPAFERLGNGYNATTTQCRVDLSLPITMRAIPTLTVSAASDWAVEHGTNITACTSMTLDQPSTRVASTNLNVASGLTAGQGSHALANNTANARFRLSSEL